jgi:hypothetical protein
MGSKKSRKQKRSLKAPKLRGYLCQDEPMMKGVSDERNLPGGKTMLKQRLCGLCHRRPEKDRRLITIAA